jgi:hypothetical protein
MKVMPQRDGMDGFFATVLKRAWKKMPRISLEILNIS